MMSSVRLSWASSSLAEPASRATRSSLNPVPTTSPVVCTRTECPYRVTKVCSTCWRSGKIIDQTTPTTDIICHHDHKWNASDVTFLIMPAKKLLKPLPHRYPRDLSFSICWHIINQNRCDRADCSFAHSEEEITVWQWMATNKGKFLHDSVFCYSIASGVNN